MQKKIKILIAEDEKAIAGALELKLNNSGFETVVAYNGQDALDFLLSDNFDLMILDLIMPKLGGFDILAKAKERGIKTPIMVNSNLSQTKDTLRAKELGAVDFFVKSDTPLSEIVDKIKKYLKI